MSKLSKSYFITLATTLLILLAIAKSITLAIWWFLPSDGVELEAQENYKPKYQRVDFTNMLIIAKKKVVKKEIEAKSTTSVTSMLLKGLYGKRFEGFAILALKASPQKTSIVSVGEVFSGYTLKEILYNGVKFTKNSKEYMLLMEPIDPKNASKSFITPVKETEAEEMTEFVTRKDIKDYADNPQKIWNSIALVEVKDGARIKGFKVTRLKENSQIAKLGLKIGDIIIRVNNLEMTSYKYALDMYKNIDNISTIAIVVLRNNQEKELVYDIN